MLDPEVYGFGTKVCVYIFVQYLRAIFNSGSFNLPDTQERLKITRQKPT